MTTKSILTMLAAMTVPTLTAQDAKQIADSLSVPTELWGGGDSKLTIPTVDGATVELLGADYEQVITPDGSLYPCEYCPEESRFGDIWHGVIDEAARKEFCRVDRTREKCKACLFLPDCTSFATCPVQDTHCRQVHELMAIDALKRMVEKKESENTDGDDPIC